MGARQLRHRVAGVHRIGAAATVHVQVDEAGQHDRQRAVGPRLGFGHRIAVDAGDALTVDAHAAAHEAGRRQHVAGDLAQAHRSRLISLTKP